MEASGSRPIKRIGETSDKDQLSIIHAEGRCLQGRRAGNANCTDSSTDAQRFGSNRGLEAEPGGSGKRREQEDDNDNDSGTRHH